ncbi:MAG: hypothetical protein IJU78_04330 [Clostridia bacterium]|nr:hypothetical protein [Clostridia bacterium]
MNGFANDRGSIFIPRAELNTGSDAPVLALGAAAGDRICLLDRRGAHISSPAQVITADLLRCEELIGEFLADFSEPPQIVAYDPAPGCLAANLAKIYLAEHPTARAVPVLHRQAHIAAVLAEHDVGGEVCALMLDTDSYGGDGALWGGDLMTGSAAASERIGHMHHLKLLGYSADSYQPWRTAIAAVASVCGRDKAIELFSARADVERVLHLATLDGIAPLSTSMERLFEVISVIAGLADDFLPEAPPHELLNEACDPEASGVYSFNLVRNSAGLIEFDWTPIVRDAVTDMLAGESAGTVCSRFQRSISLLAEDIAIRHCMGRPTLLCGELFSDERLLRGCISSFRVRGVPVYSGRLVPGTDRFISFGQAAAAAAMNGR